jgi:hypothetical protein
MRRSNLNMPAVQSAFFPFNGGLDEITPPIQVQNGYLRQCSNVEIGINGGYLPVAGYERFDGRPRPSDAVYHILNATITGSYATGNTLTGATSGATGVICTTGTDGYFVLTKVSGTFQSGENLQISAVTVAVATSANSIGAASTQVLDATYLNLAAAQYRTDIAEVPGSGDVLGVWMYNSKVYAFRNNASGTAAVMHEKSSSGWTAVALGREIAFTSGGTYEIQEGDTITGAISGATAVITRVVHTSGTWGAGSAAGRLIFASQTGTFQAEDLNVGATLNVATIAGNSSAITLLPDGRFRFDNWNFGGGAGTNRMYGCDGVNRGFEFDGTVFVPISTGMSSDTPTRVKAHKNHLFFSFGGSAQHSGIGDPYVWSPITGAGELACGDTITDFTQLGGDSSSSAMAIWTRNRTLVLYGNDSSDWNLVTYSQESGALGHTAQYITQGVVLHDQGVKLLSATQAYGNFVNAVASQKIELSLQDLIASACDSMVVRRKNQYRIFFSGGQAVYMTLSTGIGPGGTAQPGVAINGFTTVTLPNPVTCSVSGIGSGGSEELYFGSTDGFVYQMDKGTSFDGADISWSATLTFNHFGGPRQLKQFRKGVVEVTGSSYASFSASYTIGYGSTEYDSSPTTTVSSNLSNTSWDSFTWDQFFWDGRTLAPSEFDLTGTAENISLHFSGSSAEYRQFTLNSAILHYSNRRLLR